MTRLILCATLAAAPSFSMAATPAAWAHVGNTYNSAVFVDRAVLAESGPQRRFRTLHINVQTSAGWSAAEHRGVIDCAAQTLRYEGVVLTKTGGARETLPSATAKPVAFPRRGVLRTFTTSVCERRLGPTIDNPAAWTRANFKPQ